MSGNCAERHIRFWHLPEPARSSPYSTIELACEVLAYQNPHALRTLREIAQ